MSTQTSVLTSGLDLDSLSQTIDWVSHYLPHQGALQHFVHHNTLESFEDHSFDKACEIAAVLYKGQCFLEQDSYIDLLKENKMSKRQLQESIQCYLSLNDKPFQQQLLQFLCDPPRLKSKLLIEKALQKKRLLHKNYGQWEKEIETILSSLSFSEAYWDVYAYPTHAAFLRQEQGVDIDDIINPMFAKFLSSYSDPGSAYWKNETYTQGLWASFCVNYASGLWLENHWAQKVRQEIKSNPHLEDSVEKNIVYYLQKLGVNKLHWGAYLLSLALRLKGWASFFNQLEHHPEESLDDTIFRVKDFLLVKLVFEYVTVKAFVDPLTINLDIFFNEQKQTHEAGEKAQHLWNCLCFFESQGEIEQGEWLDTDENKRRYVETLSKIPYDKRLFLYQQAFENTFAEKKIMALHMHNKQRLLSSAVKKEIPVSFQYITCIDDREESLRRYLEFSDPTCETFGIAGYFEMNMHFKAFNDVRFRKLCPGGIQDTFKVTQRIPDVAQQSKSSRLYSLIYSTYSWHSRVSIWAFLMTLFTGVFAVFPLVLKLFFPGFELKIRQKMKRLFIPVDSPEDLVFHAEGNPEGVSYEAGADKVYQLLKTIGLLKDFAPFIFVVGHGSFSVNNPHEYGYNCGACGGGKGMANARVFAKIANHPQVRKILNQKYQLSISEDSRFVGGYHDTCKDTILWFDQHLSPEQKLSFQKIREIFKTVLEQNILERSQKFHNISLDMPAPGVVQKVRSRVNQIREARPEYNHATNALCIIGRRELTRYFSLDRKSFLCSYDFSLDEKGKELARLMAAAVPVCTGINLEYYFSRTDTEVFGCGSKLNHNIVNNYAVMSGFASDLRLGLSRQMVEIHSPKRMLFIVESTPAILQEIIDGNARLKRLFENEWANLYVVAEPFDVFYRFHKGSFVVSHDQEIIVQ